jgi:uncharacterized membrane protein YhiD involved in acid resistance
LSCCIVCMYLIVCPVVVYNTTTRQTNRYIHTIQQQHKQSGTYIQYNNRTNNQVHTYNTTTGQTIRYIHTIQQQDKPSGTYIQYNNRTNNQIHTYNTTTGQIVVLYICTWLFVLLLYCMYVPDCLSCCCIVCVYLIICPVVVLYVCIWLFVLLLYCMYVPDGLSCCCIVCMYLIVCPAVVLYVCTWLFVLLLYCMCVSDYLSQQQNKQSDTHIQYNNRTNNQIHTYNTTRRKICRIINAQKYFFFHSLNY